MVKTPSSNSCQRKLSITDVQAPLQDGKGFLEGQDEARQHQSSPRLPGPAEALQVNGVHHRPQQRPAMVLLLVNGAAVGLPSCNLQTSLVSAMLKLNE